MLCPPTGVYRGRTTLAEHGPESSPESGKEIDALMPNWLTILLWLLSTVSFSVVVYWGVVAFHVIRTMMTVPTLRDAVRMPAPPSWPTICLIVPAHNEERGIGLAVESIKQQEYANLRVVFALDRCTDGTRDIVQAAIGADEKFEIIDIDSCPEGWVGKVHALWEGYTRSAAARDAELLLFLDADTIMDPVCVGASVKLLHHRGLQMLSLMSTLTSDEWFERVVQPAACMELLRQYPISRANSLDRRRAFANGQFILITKEAYESVGGHVAVKGDVLEDVYFARHVAAKGHNMGLFLTDRLLVCRMYNTWEAFRRGWLRIFGECANRKPPRLREAAWRLRLTSSILPTGAMAGLGVGLAAWTIMGGVLAAATTILSTCAIAVFGGVIGYVYRAGRTPVAYTPTYVVGAWIAAGIMLRAARDLARGNPTLWGGKAYSRDVR